MGGHKGLLEDAAEELRDQFRRAGMDREPNEAEIRQRVKELVEEIVSSPTGVLDREENRKKQIWRNPHPTKS